MEIVGSGKTKRAPGKTGRKSKYSGAQICSGSESGKRTGDLKAELERLKPQVKFLVNAAGFGKIGNVCDLPEKDQSGMVQVNCTALTAVTTMVLPFMPQNSRILQFASSAAFLPQPGFAVYAASKAMC